MKENISQNDVLHLVITLSLENAEKFLDDAQILIKNSSYGHAYAFTVLALEEIGKAVYCNWTINGPLKVDDDFLKRLRDHKTKQKVIKEVEKLVVLKTEMDNYRKSKNRRKAPSKSPIERDFFLAKLESSSQFKSLEAFYGSLEKFKQLALYVDINENGIPSSPSFFTKDICDFNLNFVKSILSSAKTSMLAHKEQKS